MFKNFWTPVFVAIFVSGLTVFVFALVFLPVDYPRIADIANIVVIGFLTLLGTAGTLITLGVALYALDFIKVIRKEINELKREVKRQNVSQEGFQESKIFVPENRKVLIEGQERKKRIEEAMRSREEKEKNKIP